MGNPLSLSKIKELVKKAEFAFRHQECATCECYLGYIVQLRIDSDDEGEKFLKGILPERDQIHSCLGCDPCPPGTLHANYLRKRSSRLE